MNQNIALLRRPRFRVLIAVAALTSTAASAACHSQRWDVELEQFVKGDDFAVPHGSAFPRPQSASPQLLQHVAVAYNQTPRVRSVLAHYFLRYDAKLLKGGLLTVDASLGDLIGTFWRLEGERLPILLESPSTTLMRKHIERDARWFVLSEQGKQQLADNVAEFAGLAETWSQAAASNSSVEGK